jgi:hypothetical protein
MDNRSSRVRNSFAVAVLGLISVALGCGESANPMRPTAVSGAETAVAPAATAAPESPANVNLMAQATAGHLSPTDLTNRGWTCFEPIPNRIVCSHPNQGFPTVGDPPPADRPATFTFFVFDGTDRFVGTELLLRTDLYKGQLCESTGHPYDFVPVIGYYECVHTAGR